MRRLCYSVAVSLDGYIAGPNGEADWVVMDPDIDFESASLGSIRQSWAERRSWPLAAAVRWLDWPGSLFRGRCAKQTTQRSRSKRGTGLGRSPLSRRRRKPSARSSSPSERSRTHSELSPAPPP
jgi:hypothetical protein